MFPVYSCLDVLDALTWDDLSILLYIPHVRSSLKESNPFLSSMQKDRKVNRPWKELKTVKSIWNVCLSPGAENVRIAKSQVSPKIEINVLMLTIWCRLGLMLTPCFVWHVPFIRFVFLLCRITTTMTETNMIALSVKIIIIGARKVPQKAPRWDRKQLVRQKDIISCNASAAAS